jgi:hypothetical protein
VHEQLHNSAISRPKKVFMRIKIASCCSEAMTMDFDAGSESKGVHLSCSEEIDERSDETKGQARWSKSNLT